MKNFERKLLENGTSEIREFVFAGNSTFTVEEKNGTRFTYKVSESDDKRVYFVSLMTQPDNESPFTYMGVIRKDTKMFVRTKSSRISETAPSWALFSLLFNLIKLGALTQDNDTLKVWHIGYCARCGRKLTVPESIESGFGPECIKRQGLKIQARQLHYN